jgi:hypothetical protein
MAQRTLVTLIDDIDGGEADETIEFSFRGQTYEIDLAKDHIEDMAEFLGPYIEAGRKVSGGVARRGFKPARSAGRKGELAEIRQWAKDQGYAISERGRIAQTIVDAYHAAH